MDSFDFRSRLHTIYNMSIKLPPYVMPVTESSSLSQSFTVATPILVTGGGKGEER